MDDPHHCIMMSNLKDSVFAMLNPSKTLTPHIEQHLQQFFPSFETPSHPPYSSMIQRAIKELNSKEGLTEEEISAFLKREYKILPWGHESFLSHHLRKLCENGDISLVNHQRYVVLDEGSVSRKMKGSVRKRKGRRDRPRTRRNQSMLLQCQQENQQTQVLENTRQLQIVEYKNEAPRNTYNSVITELIDSVLEDLIATKPSRTISFQIKSCIEQRLHEFFCCYCPSYASAMGIKQQEEKTIKLERDVKESTVTEQEQSQACVGTTKSSFRSENLDGNYYVPSLKDMCMQSVKKTKQFKELLLEFSDLLQRMESNYENCENTREAKRKECHSGIKLRFSLRKPSLLVVEEGNQEKRVQVTTCEQKGIVCSLRAQRFCLSEISGVQKVAKSHSTRICLDSQQHLDYSTMEIPSKRRSVMNKNRALSPTDPRPQYQLQPPKHQGRGRPPRLKQEENVIVKNLLPSNNHNRNEKQQQLGGQGHGRCPRAITTAAWSSYSRDKNQEEHWQLQGRRCGRPPKRKRGCC